MSDSTIAEPQTVTATAAAKRIGVCVRTIYRGVERGEIRHVRIGRSIRIPRSELARLLGDEPTRAK